MLAPRVLTFQFVFRSRGRSPGRAKAAAKTKAEEPAKKAEDATDAPAKKAEKPAPKAVEKPKLKVYYYCITYNCFLSYKYLNK